MAGMKIAYYPHPVELTDKDWQKKKGLLGKMVKTGIGDFLKKAEAAHAKIDFTKIDPNSAMPKTMAELETARKDALANYKTLIVPYMNALALVKKQAEKALKDNKKMPSGTQKAIEAIVKTADTFALTMKSLDLEAAVKEAADRIAKRQLLANKFLNDSLKKFAVGAMAFLKDPTEASWGDNIKQQGRSVSNSVKELEAYNKKFWNDFSKFQGFDTGTLKLAGDPEFGKKASALVKAAVAQVKAIAAFKP